MKKAARILAYFSILFTATSLATCHFGGQLEIDKIPPEVRAGMSDTDWVGAKWVFRGMFVFAISIVFAALSLTLWLIQRRRKMLTDKNF